MTAVAYAATALEPEPTDATPSGEVIAKRTVVPVPGGFREIDERPKTCRARMPERFELQ